MDIGPKKVPNTRKLGETLRQRRLAANLTISKLSKLTKISMAKLQRHEYGRSPLTIEELVSIKNAIKLEGEPNAGRL